MFIAACGIALAITQAMTDLGQLVRVANFFAWGRRPAKEPQPLKLGVLGASQVATYALVWPAKGLSSAQVVAVAARDGDRAHDFALKNGIPRSYGSYDELLADPEVDAVYVGLPNGLHGQWADAALRAGKHVLCEKPFAANASEAARVQKLASSRRLLCREAFHCRDHPLAARLRQLVQGGPDSTVGDPQAGDSLLPTWTVPSPQPCGSLGVLGRLCSIHVSLLIPSWVFGGANIRFQEQLAGGAMMDAGCYTVNLMRLLSGGAEPRVANASAELHPGSQVVDGAAHASLTWPALPGLRGSLHASLKHPGLLPVTRLEVEGERGSLTCDGFVMPHFGHEIRVKLSGGADVAAQEWVEHAYGTDQQTTYHHQLSRFVRDVRAVQARARAADAVRAFDAADAPANQAVVDSVYQMAGLPLRLPTAKVKTST